MKYVKLHALHNEHLHPTKNEICIPLLSLLICGLNNKRLYLQNFLFSIMTYNSLNAPFPFNWNLKSILFNSI